MKSLLLILVLISCRPNQSESDYSQTYSPLGGENQVFYTNMNTPLEWSYKIPNDEKAIDPKVQIVENAQIGKNIECLNLGTQISCTYIPHTNFHGEDTIKFRTIDGGVTSENISTIKIVIRPCYRSANGEDICFTNDQGFNEVLASCAHAVNTNSLIVKTERVIFPATGECEFNEEAGPDEADQINELLNGPRKNMFIRAHLRQDFAVDLPDGATLCDLAFNFEEQAMEYDDEIFLLLNNNVMIMSTDYSENSSFESYANHGLKVKENGLIEFKWFDEYSENDLYNLEYNHNNAPHFCQGISRDLENYDELCNIPATQTSGTINLSIPKSDIIKMGNLKLNESVNSTTNNDPVFSFVTIGDNDNGDCEHSEYFFDIEIKYIDPEL